MTQPSDSLLIPMRRTIRMGLQVFTAVPFLAAAAAVLVGPAAGWSVFMGAVVPWAFFGVTAVVALRTAASSPQRMAGVVMGSWLLKLVALIVFLATLRGQDFYDKTVFGATLLAATTLMLVGEALIVQKSKTLYVDPGAGL